MNNKKLFKGALVLFASILMAVSCSAGDKTGNPDDTTQKPGDTTTQAKVDVALSEAANASATTTKLKWEGDNKTTNPAAALVIALKGADFKTAEYSIESITLVKKDPKNSTTFPSYTYKSEGTVPADPKLELSKDDTGIKLSLKATESANWTELLGDNGLKFNSGKEYSVLEVKVNCKVTGKTTTQIVAYVGVSTAA